jgi:hypothetical protein
MLTGPRIALVLLTLIALSGVLGCAKDGGTPEFEAETYYWHSGSVSYPVDWFYLVRGDRVMFSPFSPDIKEPGRNIPHEFEKVFFMIEVIEPGEVTADALKEALAPAAMLESLKKKALARGEPDPTAMFESLKPELITVAGNPAYRIDHETGRWMTLMGGEQSRVVVTASAIPSAWPDYERTFEQMLSSIRLQ